MDRYQVPITPQQASNPDFPPSVMDYLTGQGVNVLGASIDEANRLIVVADTDPGPLLTNYAYTISAKRDRVEKAHTYLDAFTDKVTASQVLTLADVAKAVTALAVIVRQRTAGMDT